jgi:hypothetical protein
MPVAVVAEDNLVKAVVEVVEVAVVEVHQLLELQILVAVAEEHIHRHLEPLAVQE